MPSWGLLAHSDVAGGFPAHMRVAIGYTGIPLVTAITWMHEVRHVISQYNEVHQEDLHGSHGMVS